MNYPNEAVIRKVDQKGKALPGVEFSLINAATREVVETVVSDDHGEFVFTKFDYGDWIIRETKAPEGFNRMDDLTLHVDENWKEPEPFTCVNIPNHYEFIKTDNRRNPIPGVEIEMTPIMWVGGGLMTVSAVVMVVYAVRSRKRRK